MMIPLEIIRSQYLASLEMLKQTIVKCPELIWSGLERGRASKSTGSE